MPCFVICCEVRGSRAAAPKGNKSCRTQGDFLSFVFSFIHSFDHLFVSPSLKPQTALSSLKSALSSFKSALPGFQSTPSCLKFALSSLRTLFSTGLCLLPPSQAFPNLKSALSSYKSAHSSFVTPLKPPVSPPRHQISPHKPHNNPQIIHISSQRPISALSTLDYTLSGLYELCRPQISFLKPQSGLSGRD